MKINLLTSRAARKLPHEIETKMRHAVKSFEQTFDRLEMPKNKLNNKICDAVFSYPFASAASVCTGMAGYGSASLLWGTIAAGDLSVKTFHSFYQHKLSVMEAKIFSSALLKKGCKSVERRVYAVDKYLEKYGTFVTKLYRRFAPQKIRNIVIYGDANLPSIYQKANVVESRLLSGTENIKALEDFHKNRRYSYPNV